MHKKKIIHRDIKLENVLVLDEQRLHVCITDMGMACRVDDKEQKLLACGSPGYIDPEILKGKGCTQKSDIFSIGSILYNLVTQSPLFIGRTAHDIIRANRNQNPKLSVRLFVKNVSHECRSLLSIMLEPNSNMRAGAEACLSHSWFLKDKDDL